MSLSETPCLKAKGRYRDMFVYFYNGYNRKTSGCILYAGGTHRYGPMVSDTYTLLDEHSPDFPA